MRILPGKKLQRVSNIKVVLMCCLLFLLFLSSCFPESDYPSFPTSSEIIDFHFCSTDDGICDDEEERDIFDATEWESIVACGILEVEEEENVLLRPYWKNDTDNVIATGPADVFNDGDLVCFSLYDSLNYEATEIDHFLNVNVIKDGKMEPGIYYVKIREYRVVKGALVFTIDD